MNFAKHKTQKEKEEEEKKRGGAPFGSGARAASRVASVGVRTMPSSGGLAGLGSMLTGSNMGAAIMVMTGLIGMAAAAGSHYLSKQVAAQNRAANDAARARALMMSGHRERSASNTSGNFGGGDGLSMLSAANRADAIGNDSGNQNANNQAAQANSADANGSNGQPNPQPTADANVGAGGQGQAGNGNRIGRLTSSMGSSSGGLAGGSGLSGGIGRSFSQFPSQGSAAGQLTAMSRQAAASTGRTASSRTPGFNSRLASLRRLGGMNGAMKNASGMGTQAQSQIHSDQWSSGQAPNSAIQGGGAGLGSPGAGSGSSIGDAGAPQEGPIASGFQQTPRSVNTSDAPTISAPENVTPWQSMIDMAKIMLYIASGLLLLATIFGLMKGIPIFGISAFAIAQALAAAAAACAAIVTMMGVMIIMQGQQAQGMIFTGIGALLTVLAAVAAYGYGQAAEAEAASQGLAEEASEHFATAEEQAALTSGEEGPGAVLPGSQEAAWGNADLAESNALHADALSSATPANVAGATGTAAGAGGSVASNVTKG